jgi:hypothetical protein
MPTPFFRALRIAATFLASVSSRRRRPSWVPCSRARAIPASTRFADHGAFELGKDANHLKHCPAGKRGGIKDLLIQKQVHALGVQFAKEVEQIDQRSANAIDRPCRDHVHLSPRHHLHHGVEPWPLVLQDDHGGVGTPRTLDPADVGPQPASNLGQRFLRSEQ